MASLFQDLSFRKSRAPPTPPPQRTPPPMRNSNARNSPSKRNPYWGGQKAQETSGPYLSQVAVDEIGAVPSEGDWNHARPKHLHRQYDAVLSSLAMNPEEWANAAEESAALKKKTAVLSRRPEDPMLLPDDEEIDVDAPYQPLGGAPDDRGDGDDSSDDSGDDDSHEGGNGGDGGGNGNRGTGGAAQNPKKRNFQEFKKTAAHTDPYKGLVNQRRPKKALRTNKFQAQPPTDLVKLNPQPIRLQYAPHPLDEQSDEWFIGMFKKLFTQTQTFVSAYYGIHDIDRNAFFEPWTCGVSPEFISWAEAVAEPDPTRDGWDSILRNTEQRQWFIMGILMRILQRKVFDEDLFGANKEQRELLHGLERALIQREGFSRQALRSETVRTIIGRAPITANFYHEVAQLTAQVSLLLNPLTNYLYALAPPDGTSTPDRFDLYQSLHSLISDAAYLSISIRLSHTIFYFVPLSPGQTYDPDDHLNFSQLSYTMSKSGIVEKHNADLKAWKKAIKPKQRKLTRLQQAGRENTAAGRKAQLEVENLGGRPHHPGNTHRALAQICSWPVVTRFKPGSDDDDNTVRGNAYLPDKDGFRIFQICKGGGVFYYGKEKRGVVGQMGRVRLRHWVRGKMGVKKAGAREVIKTGLKLVAFGVAAGVGFAINQRGFEEVANIVTGGLGAFCDGSGSGSGSVA